MSNRATGDQAEELAASYLRKIGYKILARNYQIRGGEIDIVAEDKDTLVFVEVKARWSHVFGEPLESINYFKLKTLLKTSQFYLQKINWGEKPYRIDALSLDFSESRDNPTIELIKSITS
jgi:putative endonuclease